MEHPPRTEVSRGRSQARSSSYICVVQLQSDGMIVEDFKSLHYYVGAHTKALDLSKETAFLL